MMIRYPLLAVTLVAVALAGPACAKRPSMTGASAPSPTGGAGGTAPGATGTAPTTTSSEPSRSAAAQPPGPPVAARQAPAPGEFVSAADVRDVYFDFDKYDIRAADAKVLDANGAWLQKNAGSSIIIEGHADER